MARVATASTFIELGAITDSISNDHALKRGEGAHRARGWSNVTQCRSPPLERRHHVLGEPAQLLLEFLRPDAFGPVDHEVLEAGIFRLDRLDALDDVLRRAAEPGLLLHAFRQCRDLRRRAGRTPGAALLVGIAYEAERREPLVALVMRRLDPAHRLHFAVGEIE